MKPTKKMNNGRTFHKDGTVSFFNKITGDWERAAPTRDREVFKATKNAIKEGVRLYSDEYEKIREAHMAKTA